MFDFGILWMNARNLNYIKRFNPKKSIRLADNKIKTKIFLSERGIPVPQTYGIIKNRKQLYDFDFSNFPKKDFVVKPNKWSKWQWIFITKFLWELETINQFDNSDKSNFFWLWKYIDIYNKFFEKRFGWLHTSNNFYKVWWEQIDDNTFRRYLLDIIDGKHSLTMWNDTILIEEKLIPWQWFKRFCEHGLADIRVIVFNLVPVAAMVRIPTEKSWWKANLAQWWIAMWIEVWTWKIFSFFENRNLYTKSFPEKYWDYLWYKIPFWNDILAYSSEIQYFVNLWYLALDWVITDEWPKLLEINARAWLEVQNVCALNLKQRLNKVSWLRIIDPEKWVEIAKTLFSSVKSEINVWKILFLNQYGKLILKTADDEEIIDLIVEVDVNRQKSYISTELFEKYNKAKQNWKIVLNLPETDLTIKTFELISSEKIKWYKIILWKDVVSEYYIKPTNKVYENIDIINSSKIDLNELDILRRLDMDISKVSKKLSLSSVLRPVNYFEQLDNFITFDGRYDPKFVYNFPEENKLKSLEEELYRINDKVSKKKIKSEFVNLFTEKLQELDYRYSLIKAYKNQDFEWIYFYNTKLFADFNIQLLSLSKQKIFDNPIHLDKDMWNVLDIYQVQKIVEKYLLDKWINNIEISSSVNNISRMSVMFGKNIKIWISQSAVFYENEIMWVLAHEIDTHLIRYLNWQKTWWNIFKSWTWFYIWDEEGLAIYNSQQAMPNDIEKLTIYKKYYLLDQARNYSFSQMFDLVKFLYPGKPFESCFKAILRTKKWIEDTSVVNNWAIHMKDKIYLDWYYRVKDFIENWWDISKMYKWKIKISDMDFII